MMVQLILFVVVSGILNRAQLTSAGAQLNWDKLPDKFLSACMQLKFKFVYESQHLCTMPAYMPAYTVMAYMPNLEPTIWAAALNSTMAAK